MSWLLSLPAELREMIYNFALTDDDSLVCEPQSLALGTERTQNQPGGSI